MKCYFKMDFKYFWQKCNYCINDLQVDSYYFLKYYECVYYLVFKGFVLNPFIRS